MHLYITACEACSEASPLRALCAQRAARVSWSDGASLCTSATRVAHRTRRWDLILSDPVRYPPVPAARVAELDVADNGLKRAARKLGHSRVPARVPVRRADGSVVGRALTRRTALQA